jgi:Aspartyl protease
MTQIKSIAILLLLIGNTVFAQNLPVIRASSKNVKIRDGANFKENFWVIFPETKPDIYYVDIPRKEQKVTFITDKDSISFEVKFGKTYDFIILLNGKDSCYTRISATFPKTVKLNSTTVSDTIPFTMRDNRIYVKGKINGSEDLMFQFDLGASGLGMGFINHRSAKKVKMNFDKTTNLINSDGANQTRLSSSNEINIGNTKWQNIEFVETKNMKNYEDGIFGNGLFLDKYIEVDYDKKMLIIHDKMPVIDEKFKKYSLLLDNGIRPVIEAEFELGGKKYKDWFLFDTGNTGNGILSYHFLTKHNIYDKFSKIMAIGNRAFAKIPQLHFADNTFSEGVITLEKNNKNASSYANGGGLLGNQLLKKFNFIIDNQQGVIYLKPNFFLMKKTKP